MSSTAVALRGSGVDHTIQEGVAKFVDWYEQNREWYEPLVLAS